MSALARPTRTGGLPLAVGRHILHLLGLVLRMLPSPGLLITCPRVALLLSISVLRMPVLRMLLLPDLVDYLITVATPCLPDHSLPARSPPYVLYLLRSGRV
jgi:hypothetical protein